MLTYYKVHLFYTLPIVLLLWIILHPFLCRKEKLKILALNIIAFLYTTPWDNYIVYHKAWSYHPQCVLGSIGYIPIEEYAFFIIMTIMDSLWCVLCMRWTIPCLYFPEESKFKSLAIRWVPIALFTSGALWGLFVAIPATKSFYMGCICWWALPILAFLWYGAGNYVWKRKIAVFFSITVPSTYLCYVDIIAMRAGVWHISEDATYEIFVYDCLPIEEFVFFFVVSSVIVMGCCAFDKSQGILDTYPELFHFYKKPSKLQILFNLFQAFLTDEFYLPEQPIHDLRTSMIVLEEASKSFSTAGIVFPTGVRKDLSILYAFCRVTDNMIDNESIVDKRKDKVNLIKKFIDELSVDRAPSWKYDVGKKIDPKSVPNIDWSYYEKHLKKNQLAAFRAISRISYYLPLEPFRELIRGYEWDINEKMIETDSDLLEYSSYVASSVATLFTCIMCFKSDFVGRKLIKEDEWLIERARDMGKVLQIINISRDIVTDSETLGRTYIPTSYFEDPKKELQLLRSERKPWSLGEQKLRDYALKMIRLADSLMKSALQGVPLLPPETQGPVLAATQVYSGIGIRILSTPGYQRRARLSKLERLAIAVNCMFFKSSFDFEAQVKKYC
ncbi:bifunctional lycopene cyclase/phytoene synthase-like isoform X2 [Dinothrombium tinctorium]|uniref:Bifunctional lycopene cyclase/phytoene synthase n=1 Tax=Dinothrombium tinctorium TaxID=1965070 RepID=A0A3S4R4Y5_9ACAR|nr:bifunctional lycopene cyclase/phytoene synthase-like isoform X2 [Dinothrombium tinctorium]RWS11658.1 bifunctional lycopene cyclase/phytoene synthase-like isoform X2 [Dinothrombium tinctorium]RWS12045.1 bifunctional lycopene cyclase/phytoene synthase-like isoform X2 [Dinothrombium tinctorium]RWS12938.1 bifunctional lycopene cyclase/phytoene synthase-like isoform X2 [Dinothrombium tinctorium]